MPIDDVPEAVRGLIASMIDSVPELEAILLLRDHPEHPWSVEEAGERLYVSRTVAAHILETLAERGFFVRDRGEAATSSTEQTFYRYQPANERLEHDVQLLAASYSTHLREVTMLIHSKPSAGVRQFAEAFRLRRDK